MAVEIINLTPEASSPSYVVRVGLNDTPINLDGDSPSVNGADTASLIAGAVDHAAIEFASITGVNGKFKKPPFVLNCKLRDAVLINDGIVAPFNDYVIVTDDGRVYFKPTALAAIRRAVAKGDGDIKAVTAIGVDVTVVPVYYNPSAPMNEEYEPDYVSIVFDCSDIDWGKLAPTDWVDSEPYIDYTSGTTSTPASVG